MNTAHDNLSSKKPWYKKWWGWLLLFCFWPITVPIALVQSVWNKDHFSQQKKMTVTGIIIAFTLFVWIGIGSSDDKSQVSSISKSGKVNPVVHQEQVQNSFDIPVLLGKTAPEIEVILGKPKSTFMPTKQQQGLGINEATLYYEKGPDTLTVTFDPKTKKVIDFFVSNLDPIEDKNILLQMATVKADSKDYDLKFVEALKYPGKYTGLEIIPITAEVIAAKKALIAKRQSFDTTKGDNADTAEFVDALVKLYRKNNVETDMYLSASVPADKKNAYLAGGDEKEFRQSVTSMQMTVMISSITWSSVPDSTKKDFVATIVSLLRAQYPKAYPHVRVTNGISDVASGSWSVWNEAPDIELED